MTPNEMLKAKRQAQATKIKDKLCRSVKAILNDHNITISSISSNTYMDCKNICDILNCKGDPQLSTICNIMLDTGYELIIAKKKPDGK